MIAVGDLAPPFTGMTGDGSPIDSAKYLGRPFILYFYPKANTSGCSIEARGFSESYPALRQAGIDVIGVSVDSVAAQRSFAERCDVPFPLIADQDKAIAKAYGVLGILGIAKRVTFVVGPDGRVTELVQGMLPGPHVRRAAQLARGAGPGVPPT